MWLLILEWNSFLPTGFETQPLLLTLEEEYLLTASPPDLELGVAPLGPPKFWKRWEYQTTWPASWETYMKVKKQQLELDMEQ